MGTTPSVVFPSSKSWLGIARELTTGTPVSPTNTIPIDKGSYQPEDTPKFLPDEAIRGVMAMLYNDVLGVEDATFSFGGPNFLDVDGFWLDNVFGDLSSTSQGTLGTAPTLATATAIGATNLGVSGALAGTVPSGSVIQISDGSASEIVITSSGSGTDTIFFTNYPLRFPHTTSATASLQSADAGYTHVFSVLNSGSGQPPTHTLTDYTGITASVGARAYPSACVSQIDITGNAEQLLDFKVSGNSWLSSAAGQTPTNTTAFVVPVANWRSTIEVNSTLVYDVGEWSCSIKRQLQIYWTAQNSQTPYIIARGGLGITGTLDFSVAVDESPLQDMLGGTPLPVLITLSNGSSGTGLLEIIIQASRAQFVKSKPTRNAVLIGYQDEWEGTANTSDVGGSGGLSPCQITLKNNIPTY